MLPGRGCGADGPGRGRGRVTPPTTAARWVAQRRPRGPTEARTASRGPSGDPSRMKSSARPVGDRRRAW
eukprot:366566-Chlamydomonas_euryale.AAC.20